MKNEYAIEVNGLSKKYTKKDETEFFALKDISFKLKKGETLGIIGSNGSGKSTLLKILSGILKPSSGNAVLNGKVASIIDIGTGFHPDLTGKENAFLSGTLMGMTKNEIENVYDDLVDFSEIIEFIDEPVKSYSSGMYMRLAFSIFAFLKPEILILDEVFSVGDVAFQKKCVRKLRDLIDKGTTVIMVSHNMDEVSTICKRIILLNKGNALKDGTSTEVSTFYLENILLNNNFDEEIKTTTYVKFDKPICNGVIELNSVGVRTVGTQYGEEITMDDEIEVVFEYEKIGDGSVQFILFVSNTNETPILSDTYGLRKDFKPQNNELGLYSEKAMIPSFLFNAGLFFISITIIKDFNMETENRTEINKILSFKIFLENWDKKNIWSHLINTPLRPKFNWKKYKR